jgi:hypothetical protein
MANFIDQLYNNEYKRKIKTKTKGEETTTGHYKGPKHNTNILKSLIPPHSQTCFPPNNTRRQRSKQGLPKQKQTSRKPTSILMRTSSLFTSISHQFQHHQHSHSSQFSFQHNHQFCYPIHFI